MAEKTISINELKNNMLVENELFILDLIELKKSKTGNEYYNVLLKDKTGEINGKIWSQQIANVDKEAKTGDIVEINGVIQTFRDTPQIVISKMIKNNNSDRSQFMAASLRDTTEMKEYISNTIDSIQNNHIKTLCKNLWDGELHDAIVTYPAAMSVHHAYIGGLLEHLYEMLKISLNAAELFNLLNKDMLIAGILFHDIGKIYEYEYQGSSIITTKNGQLIGHISQGVLILNKYVQEINDFPVHISDQIAHIILSHHDELEYGSPVLPKTIEAIIVANADRLSSKMHIALDVIEKEKYDEKEFTSYIRWLGVSVLKPNE